MDDHLSSSMPSLQVFWPTSSKNTLWLGGDNTLQLVIQAVEGKTLPKQAGGSGVSHSECRIRSAVNSTSVGRKIFSWTESISQDRDSRQITRVLRMQEGGVKLSSDALVAALKACTSLQDLECAKQIYAELVRTGFQLDGYVGTMLLNVYTKFGQLVDAKHIFEIMRHRNIVSWNAMILGYAKIGEGGTALHLYEQMQEEGVIPNDRTFVAALKACSSLAVVEKGQEADGILVKEQCLVQVRAIHSHILKSRFMSVIFVGTMLVDAYAKCGSLVDARNVFESMSCRNVVSWTAMIFGYAQMGEVEVALHLYKRMQEEGVIPNNRTFIGVLKACSSMVALEEKNQDHAIPLKRRCLEQARSIHVQVVKNGSQLDMFVGNMLVDVYVKCGSLVDARIIFEKMLHRDVVCWNAMIMGYSQVEDAEEVLQLYTRMQEGGVVPDDRTFLCALKACSSLASIEEGNEATKKQLKQRCLDLVRSIHSQVEEHGSESAFFVQNMLVDVYAKCGSMVDARTVFEQMPHHNVVSWTSMILGYAQVAEGELALQLYRQMQQEGVVPDDRAFVGALKACSSFVTLEHRSRGAEEDVLEPCLELVRAIHSDVVKMGLELNVFVATMLVDVYAKCGSLEDARCVFEKIPHRNVVSWNTMILGYSQRDKGEEALQLYAQMQKEGVVPNDRTFVAALKACTVVAGLIKGKEIHAQISESDLEATSLHVPTTLIDMYGKCGSMENAQQVFDGMARKDITTWNALIAGYARQGESAVVFELLQKMKQDGVLPDGITFLSVLSVCSYVGLVDTGQRYFEAMSRDFGIQPSLDHYTCLADLLGRAGQLGDAIAVVHAMPFQPDGALWLTVLAACQKWCNVEHGRQAFECAVRLDENAGAAYVLMANIYAAAQRWDEANNIIIQARRMTTGAWKEPGQTWWTDIDGVVHTFLVGGEENPELQDIYANLRELSVRPKEDLRMQASRPNC